MALLQAAGRLLENHSYSEVSVERIVGEAGLSRPTFYAHFKDKAELLSAVAEHVIGRVVDALTGWWQLPPGATQADLHAASEEFVARFVANERIWLALSEAAAFDPAIGRQLADLRREAGAEFAVHIAAGQRAGSVHRDLDAEAVGVWLTALLERGLTQLVASAATVPARRRLETALTQIVWNTLYAGGA